MREFLEFVVQIPDWRLTTAEILYHLPDHPGVLQTFVWQKLDRAPAFPELLRFLILAARDRRAAAFRARRHLRPDPPGGAALR